MLVSTDVPGSGKILIEKGFAQTVAGIRQQCIDGTADELIAVDRREIGSQCLCSDPS
jgi:hypothetical protein